MPPVAEKLTAMRRRLDEPDRAQGLPVIPDGPVASRTEIELFEKLCNSVGYTVRHAGPNEKIATNHGRREVRIARWNCTTGLLTDEYLHVWNNSENRGKYFTDPAKSAEHHHLAAMGFKSGTPNDRRFHKLELENFILWAETSGGAIPPFVWRTF